jgi:thioredoxin reductase (NADPH)
LGEPIVLVVTDRDSVGAVLVGDLRRRFGADYRVIEVGSGEAALAAVADASARSQEVALVIADQTMTGVPAIEILVRVRELTAKRVLLIDRGDWSPTHPVVSAMALGQVDYHLYNPWHPLERILYPAVSDFLSAWNKSQDAPVVPARIVGARSSPRSHQLRDILTRVSVPYWYYYEDSTEGRQLLAEAGVDSGSRRGLADAWREDAPRRRVL